MELGEREPYTYSERVGMFVNFIWKRVDSLIKEQSLPHKTQYMYTYICCFIAPMCIIIRIQQIRSPLTVLVITFSILMGK